MKLKKYVKEKEFISKKDLEIIKKLSKNNKDLSENGFQMFSKIINRMRREKYSREYEYTDKKKGISPNQFEIFLNCVNKEKFKLIFILMYKLGLRVGEVVKIKIYDIDFSNYQLLVHNEKCNRKDILLIPLSVREILKNYIEKNKIEISKNKDYIFPAEKKFSYVSKDFVRNYFRKISIISGINKPRVQIRNDEGARNLYEFGTHSFRRGFCNNFYALSNCPKKTQLVMRHKKITTTMDVYLEIDKKEVFNLLENF